MEETVHVQYPWTLEELRKVNEYHRQQTFGKLGRTAMLAAPPLFMLAASLEVFWHHRMAGGIAFAGIGLWILWLMILRPGNLLKKQFQLLSEKAPEVMAQITTERILLRTAMSQSEFKWEALDKVVRTSDGLLLYTGPGALLWLPRDAFRKEEDFESVGEQARSRVKNYTEQK